MLPKIMGQVALIICFVFLLNKISTAQNKQPWVKIDGVNFIKDGKPFKFIGANAVNLVFYDDWDLDIEKAMRSAKENNISVLRLYMDWGWGKDEDYDRIINLASKYGIYVMLSLTDCCCSKDCPSLDKYYKVHAPFCNINNKNSKIAFKKRIKRIIERKNCINGRMYRDDPVILAWEIANELEYWNFSYDDVRKWAKEISSFIKSLDVNHPVTISITIDNAEFDKDTSIYEIFNLSGIDFFSFHFYPSYKIINPANKEIKNDYEQQIEFRIRKLLGMNKPVVMSEFGFSNSSDINQKVKNNPNTSTLYNLVFKKSFDSAFFAGASGVMFWGWGVPEEKTVPMWWSNESHSTNDIFFCQLLKKYLANHNIDAKHYPQ